MERVGFPLRQREERPRLRVFPLCKGSSKFTPERLAEAFVVGNDGQFPLKNERVFALSKALCFAMTKSQGGTAEVHAFVPRGAGAFF